MIKNLSEQWSYLVELQYILWEFSEPVYKRKTLQRKNKTKYRNALDKTFYNNQVVLDLTNLEIWTKLINKY